MPSSRLVETVMINVEDFSENFLTCGTCLSGYDQNEHTAKLLPCSHTICKHCIKRIIELQMPRLDHFRCPICRETIPVPAVGGANAFPPAFIVNQLLDLLANQRRDLVPTCQRHPNQELLFCETCDVVFCTDCRGRQHQKQALHHNNDDCLSIDDNHNDYDVNCDHGDQHYHEAPSSLSPQMSSPETHTQILSHNVISFNVAIKRCSEILLYKAHLCVQELNSAQDAVSAELDRLELNTDKTVNAIKNSFEKIRNLVNQREKDLLGSINRLADDKRKALTDQLSMIQSERLLVRKKCDTIRERIDVRSISRGISYLNDKLDTIASLTEPRENAFLHYEDSTGQNLLAPQSHPVLSTSNSPVSLSNTQNSTTGILRRQNTVTPSSHSMISSSSKSLSNQSEDGSRSEATLAVLSRYLSTYGRIIISTTYPALCTIKLPEESLNVNLTDEAIMYTVDYHGHPQTSGNHDPIEVYFIGPDDELAQARLIKNSNGTYRILMRPRINGLHKLSVYILQRSMRGSPFQINVRLGQRPKWTVRKGDDNINFIQPFALTSNQRTLLAKQNYNIYILDTGNCRTVILNHSDGTYVGSFYGDAFKGQAATGIAYLHPISLNQPAPDQSHEESHEDGEMLSTIWPSSEGAIVVSNWRERAIFLLHPTSGEILDKISSTHFVEPTSVCVCPSTGLILVADNAVGCIFTCKASLIGPAVESGVTYEIDSLIGNPIKSNQANIDDRGQFEESNIRKSYSLHEKHKTISTPTSASSSSSGFGLRRSLMKNRDQAMSLFSNKTAASPLSKRHSLRVANSTEKIPTLTQKADLEATTNKKSIFKKINGLCVDMEGTIILASGSMLQIYSRLGKHIKDLTLTNLETIRADEIKRQPNNSTTTTRLTSHYETSSSSLRPHSTLLGSVNPFDITKRHVSMVEDYRHSQSIFSNSPNLHVNSRQNTFQSINFPSGSRRTISNSESSNNQEDQFESSTSDLSLRSNRSLYESENFVKRFEKENVNSVNQKRTRNHSSNQHNGQFYGVSIGRLESKEIIGDCLLATFTDRQRSMVVVWPENSWKNDPEASSTVTLNKSDNSPNSRDENASPYVLEVDPVLRRSAGIISIQDCRDVVVVDLGASSVHRLRYS